ncbi:hypothetical protein [Bacteroides faecis]|jgi:hypothetical protein
MKDKNVFFVYGVYGYHLKWFHITIISKNLINELKNNYNKLYQ